MQTGIHFITLVFIHYINSTTKNTSIEWQEYTIFQQTSNPTNRSAGTSAKGFGRLQRFGPVCDGDEPPFTGIPGNIPKRHGQPAQVDGCAGQL